MSSPFQKKFSAKSPIGPTPLTKKSPCYQTDDKKSGEKTTYRDGTVIRDKATNKVILGGGNDAGGDYVGKTAQQKASDWDQDPRNTKGSEAKRRAKVREEKKFNDPANVAKREANKAKLDAARKARQERDKKKG